VGTDGELNRKPSDYPRFKKSKNVPKFSLGMKSNSNMDGSLGSSNPWVLHPTSAGSSAFLHT
jgi:hypothetical protein